MSRSAPALVVLAVVFAGCAGAPEPASPDGPPHGVAEWRLTPERERAAEVTIAANPVDPANLVVAANSMGGFALHRTADAGASWTASRFRAEDVARLAAGAPRFQRLSDPALAFGPAGELYLAGLAFQPTSAVFVAKSHDGGATWSSVGLVDESDIVTAFNDKEWLAVGPKTGTIIVAWQKEPAQDMLRDVEMRTGLDVDIGDIVVSRSTDGGATWSKPALASRGRHNNGTQVAFTPDGRAHLLWVNYETSTLDHVVSSDDGATWSAPRAAADVKIAPPLPRYARMHTLPALVADPEQNVLHAVWHDFRHGDVDVLAATSLDGGATWAAPRRVNDDAVGNGVHQLYPWAAVDPAGALHVAFYDMREDPSKPRFRFFHASSAIPGGPFGANRPVSLEPFTAFAKAGVGPTDVDDERRSFGDYTGLAANDRGVFPAWTDGRHEVETIYVARIPPS
ncbi:MAG TPA: sialidase family protein [Candidatus Thermoplasmatota archaeon]|nr:sialidase family protein [Candidatus Thermoplasmatota archaeon]